jgi:hypothetical protein
MKYYKQFQMKFEMKYLVKLVIVTVARIVESPFMCMCNGRLALTGYCKIWEKGISIEIKERIS